MTDIKNKVVVITGAAHGLGKALATEFYKNGCHLALIDIDFDGLQQVKSEIDDGKTVVSIHHSDISNEESIQMTRIDILNNHRHIDILVNNAGISISQNFEEMKLSDYRNLFDVNFWGTIYCTRYFLPDLKEQKNSRIVNIISDFAFMGFFGKTAYGSSKSAIWGFTNALKVELNDNVKISFVVPPPLNTELIKTGKHIDAEKRAREVAFLKRNHQPLDWTARRIVNQIKKGKYRIIVGTMMYWLDLMARLSPTFLHFLIRKSKHHFDFV